MFKCHVVNNRSILSIQIGPKRYLETAQAQGAVNSYFLPMVILGLARLLREMGEELPARLIYSYFFYYGNFQTYPQVKGIV